MNPPSSQPDLRDGQAVAALFQQAAQALLNHPLRQGATIHLPDQGSLLVSGDLHDHGQNYQRILKLADLHRQPDRYLIFQELIHGPNRVNDLDLSIRMLARCCHMITQYPERVVLLLANHDLAQLHGEAVQKAGMNAVEAFDGGIDQLYPSDTDEVRQQLHALIQSLPLAVRTAKGLWISHSLPAPHQLKDFDTELPHRSLQESDLEKGGDAYRMVWGRKHTQQALDHLAKAWEVQSFLLGHQPAEMGCEYQADSSLIVTSEHEHGVAIDLDLAKTYDQDGLYQSAKPLAGVTLP